MLTSLQPTDQLHLTCTRQGTCCHGHQIFISPWELALLAQGKQLTAQAFRDRYTDFGGTRLVFDGAPWQRGPVAWRGKQACSQYDPVIGCTVHAHRPLACRLYPLGRQRHEGTIRYYHVGERLPCFELCTDVEGPEPLSVGDYLAGQYTAAGEAAHDGYAALAYGMVKAVRIISGQLSDRARSELADYFAELIALSIQQRTDRIPALWLDRLTIPVLGEPVDNAAAFVAAHGKRLSLALQTDFAAVDDLAEAARIYLLLALHLGVTVGTDPAVMAEMLAEKASA